RGGGPVSPPGRGLQECQRPGTDRGRPRGRVQGEAPATVRGGRCPGEAGPGEGSGGQAAVADLGGGDLVGPPLDAPFDLPGQRPQQRVRGGGEAGELDVELVVAREVGAFVGQQDPALVRRQDRKSTRLNY